MIFFPSSFPIPKILKVSNHSFSLTDNRGSLPWPSSLWFRLFSVHSEVVRLNSRRTIFFNFLFTTQPSGLLSQKDFCSSLSSPIGESVLLTYSCFPWPSLSSETTPVWTSSVSGVKCSSTNFPTKFQYPSSNDDKHVTPSTRRSETDWWIWQLLESLSDVKFVYPRNHKTTCILKVIRVVEGLILWH